MPDSLDLTETDLAELRSVNECIPLDTMIALRQKGLSHTQISKILGCTKSNVQKRLSKVREEIAALPGFKAHRADIMAIHQRRILESITDEKLEKASLAATGIAYGVLYDKERLERGQSTSNVVYAELVEAKRMKKKELEKLELENKGQVRRGVRLLPKKSEVMNG